MQIKLQATLLTVGLLWTSLMSAATHKHKAQNITPVKARYVGTASWYGKHHQGRKMANGERFDRHQLTAACWFLPFGTKVRVKNLDNGKEIIVTVTDRGPSSRLNRIIDLSEAAASQLDFLITGTTKVLIQPIYRVETEQAELNNNLVEFGSI
jgi:rare lipoprotein A